MNPLHVWDRWDGRVSELQIDFDRGETQTTLVLYVPYKTSGVRLNQCHAILGN